MAWATARKRNRVKLTNRREMSSVKETAKRLGISCSKLYDLVERREIPHYRIEGKILFSDEQIREFLASCLVEKAGAPAEEPPPKTSPGFTMLDGERLREAWKR
jgi:excisionase family DNA binding protein